MALTRQQQPPVLKHGHAELVGSGGPKRQSNALRWMGAAFAVALGLAIVVLARRGINERSLRTALVVTGRWAFIPFWLAYTSGAVATLFGPTLASLRGRGREWGLAFAAALSVHLSVVLGLFILTWRPPLTGSGLVMFLTAAFLTYLLTVFSFGGLAKALGSAGWRILRFVALNFILYAFATDFVPGAIHSAAHYGSLRFILYAPFAVMAMAAPLLVAAATICRRFETRRQVKFEPVVN